MEFVPELCYYALWNQLCFSHVSVEGLKDVTVTLPHLFSRISKLPFMKVVQVLTFSILLFSSSLQNSCQTNSIGTTQVVMVTRKFFFNGQQLSPYAGWYSHNNRSRPQPWGCHGDQQGPCPTPEIKRSTTLIPPFCTLPGRVWRWPHNWGMEMVRLQPDRWNVGWLAVKAFIC